MPDVGKETCWSLIRSAQSGRNGAREAFAERYLPVVHAYLQARWAASPFRAELDDVVQEVFVACFRDGGALARVDEDHPSGFRAFLHGVTRNVALNAERRRAYHVRTFPDAAPDIEQAPVDEATLSKIFDRAYAEAVMQEARDAMERRAVDADAAAQRRVELLRLRFEEGLPIRRIATMWNVDAALLHREQSKALRDFKRALAEVVSESEQFSSSRLEEECQRLLSLLKA